MSMKNDELKHHGVKGMKWGVRRYQNKDGSYTSLGKKTRKKAIKELERNIENDRELVKGFRSEAKRFRNTAANLRKHNKSEDKNGFDLNYYDAQAKFNSGEAKYWARSMKISKTRLSQVKNNTIKAGQDYFYEKYGRYGRRERLRFNN